MRSWGRAFGSLLAALSTAACQNEALVGSSGETTSGAATSSGAAATSSSVASSSASSSGATSGAGGCGSNNEGAGPIGPQGGTLSTLAFAIVGGARAPVVDDVPGFPSPIVTKIWQDIEAFSPRPPFAIGTGTYMFASTTAMPGTQDAQLDLYLCARAAYQDIFFPAMGNHECNGETSGNCGPGAADGVTPNYQAFSQKMLAPIGQALPYYTVNIGSDSGAWTAKLVFVACNYWSATQAAWLDQQLSAPTTYTFVVRHEGAEQTTAPCLAGTPNAATIMAQHPFTLLIAGQPSTVEHVAADKELVVGNGGAPLAGPVDYGYVIAQQRADGAVAFTAYDYMTNAQQTTFAVNADGTPAP